MLLKSKGLKAKSEEHRAITHLPFALCFMLFKHWIKLIVIGEAALFIFNHNLIIGYIVIAALFFIGFLLRVLKIYPGKEEPLILDISATLISTLFIGGAYLLRSSNGRFLLILFSSLIVFPHFIYIIKEKL